jgi:hypothetical protein
MDFAHARRLRRGGERSAGHAQRAPLSSSNHPVTVQIPSEARSSSLSLVPCSPLAIVLDTQVHATAMHELVREPSLGTASAAPFLFSPVHCDPPCRPHPRPPASLAQAANSLIGSISTRSTACSRVPRARVHRRPTVRTNCACTRSEHDEGLRPAGRLWALREEGASR